MTLQVPYPEMVEKLFKYDTLPAMYLHVGVGIVGEVIEYLASQNMLGDPDYNKNAAHVLEELGDLAFFSQKLCALFGRNLEDYAGRQREPGTFLLYEANEILDCCKRFGIYNKQLEHERLEEALGRFMGCFFSALRVQDFALEQVQEANQKKLLTGEKARYKLGKYTDEQANARADKAQEG